MRRWEVRYIENSIWRVAGSCVTKREARMLRDSWCIRSGGRGRLKTKIIDLLLDGGGVSS